MSLPAIVELKRSQWAGDGQQLSLGPYHLISLWMMRRVENHTDAFTLLLFRPGG